MEGYEPQPCRGEQLWLNLDMPRRKPDVREVLFFTVMPGVEAAARISALGRDLVRRQGLSGRLHPPNRLHISLLGLAVDAHGREEQVSLAKQVGSSVRAPPLEVVLSTALSFGRGRLRPLVLGCRDDSAAALSELQTMLVEAVGDRNVGLRRRSAFVPHLTLAYREPAIPATALNDPIAWCARELVLVCSEQGRGRYRRLGRWPLR